MQEMVEFVGLSDPLLPIHPSLPSTEFLKQERNLERQNSELSDDFTPCVMLRWCFSYFTLKWCSEELTSRETINQSE